MNVVERLRVMRKSGYQVVLPHTDRNIRLRTVDALSLLRENKLPDILTPLAVKSVYTDISDKDIKEVEAKGKDIKEAIEFAEAIDLICSLAIADGTPLEELVSSEKRWVFRLVLGPAELLVTFREDENSDVGVMVPEYPVPEAA